MLWQIHHGSIAAVDYVTAPDNTVYWAITLEVENGAALVEYSAWDTGRIVSALQIPRAVRAAIEARAVWMIEKTPLLQRHSACLLARPLQIFVV